MSTRPTTIPVDCECGERFHADERSVGRRLRCRRCGRTIELRRPDREWKPGATWELARRRERERDTERERRRGSSSPSPGRRRRRSDRSWLRRLLPTRFRGARARPTRASAAATGAGRVVATLSWTYLAGACVAALLIWGFGDAWWPATVLLFAGRWVALLPLALLVPAALLLARRSLAPLLAAALIVLFPVMGLRTGWRRVLPGPTVGAHFRVVTLNADGGDWIVAQLPFLLRDWSPDAVALQECGAELAASARALATSGGGWYEHDVGGLCLLARHPIRGASVMDREALERVRQARSGIGGAGYVVRYTLDTPAGAVTLTNLHLETPRKGFEGLTGADGIDSWRLRENTVLRDIESDLARRWAVGGGDGDAAGADGAAAAPLLVVGDFNTPVESRIFRRHWGDLADAFSVAGVGLGMTKYNGWIRARIDHVLAGGGWHVDRAVVGDDVGSDHRPLVVDLTLEARR